MLFEHMCRTRREPVPAVKRADGTVECIPSQCCRDCGDGLF